MIERIAYFTTCPHCDWRAPPGNEQWLWTVHMKKEHGMADTRSTVGASAEQVEMQGVEALMRALFAMPEHTILGMARGIRDAVVAKQPEPDVKIGGADDPYNLRWWVIPRNKYPFNVYLHNFVRSDHDAALHDHPWANLSILIEGDYIEEVALHPDQPAGARRRILRRQGSIVLRNDPKFSHRVELLTGTRSGHYPLEPHEVTYARPVWTLFITGPKVREWGFHCPKGWIDWQTFTGQDESNGPVRLYNNVRGCGET